VCACGWAQGEYVVEPITDADLAAKEGFARAGTAAYDAVIDPLSDEERGLVKEASKEAQQIVDVAGPLVRLTDVPEEVNEACTWLQKDPPPYLQEFPDQPAALAFCAQLLAQTPLLMMHIRDRTRRVSLATVALATGATGIYVVDTTVKTERAEALHRGEAGEVPSRVCRVVAIKLKNAPRAETVEFLYTGQSGDTAATRDAWSSMTIPIARSSAT
jgi:hypothetical protein